MTEPAPLDLGEPFATYGRLLAAYGDARRAGHEATVAGDRQAAAAAELAEGEAVAAMHAFKADLANALLLAMRFAEELYPGRVKELSGAAREPAGYRERVEQGR